jgi:hypothetical protein
MKSTFNAMIFMTLIARIWGGQQRWSAAIVRSERSHRVAPNVQRVRRSLAATEEAHASASAAGAEI